MSFAQGNPMPDYELSPSSSTAGDTSSEAQSEIEAERECLIDHIAFLVVRQHRRKQLQRIDPSEPVVCRSHCADKGEKRPSQQHPAAAIG
ncbi:MAG: hypothetical protein IID46_05305 [Planctomycetes bacterium]|nr:hypothetical protein [Planctomycetota bacterium]